MGDKTIIKDAELQAIVPIHPYAALLLKHMSVAFNSNARSMFDFIISNDMTDAKAFKWYINNYGPLDEKNLLTIDMLWDFFTGADHSGLNDDVRVILDSYNLLKKDSAGITVKVYDWMDNSSVKNKLKTMAEKQYRLKGRERAMAVIDKMDASELRRYLSELIADNLTVGMEIIKNE